MPAKKHLIAVVAALSSLLGATLGGRTSVLSFLAELAALVTLLANLGLELSTVASWR